jgi:hypothetical protein
MVGLNYKIGDKIKIIHNWRHYPEMVHQHQINKGYLTIKNIEVGNLIEEHVDVWFEVEGIDTDVSRILNWDVEPYRYKFNKPRNFKLEEYVYEI